jgi:hypothetical protein
VLVAARIDAAVGPSVREQRVRLPAIRDVIVDLGDQERAAVAAGSAPP